MGKISDDKTRYLMLIEKDLKLELEIRAKEENRSLNNLITKILADYIKDKK
jgi:predicted HicB family RNase H-like nuclease